MSTMIQLRLVTRDNASLLQRVEPDVFDGPVSVRWTDEFLSSGNHHLIVAMEGDTVVGMVSGVHYVHPDKAPQLWINELGVAGSYRRLGIGRRLVQALLDHGRAIGCTESWVGTEVGNTAARRLYEDLGGTGEEFVLYFFPLGEPHEQRPQP